MRDKQAQTVKKKSSLDSTFPIIIPKTLFSSTKDKKIYKRYSELVDKKLLNTLSPEEKTELSVINTTLDKLEAPVYDAIYTSLKQFLENKKSSEK